MFGSNCGVPLTGNSSRYCSNCGAEQPTTENTSTPVDQPVAGTAVAQTQSVPDSSSSGGATPRTGSFLEVGRVDVGMMTFLSTITLGIYFLVWLYKAMRVYRTLSGRAGVNLEQYFWATVIAFGSAVILPRLPSAGLLVTLLVVSNGASLTVCGLIIGIPVAIWLYYRFFTGHNLLVGTIETGREVERR